MSEDLSRALPRLPSRLRVASPSKEGAPPVLDCVQEALRGLRYGAVTVVVQDGVVVQVERTDKLRLRTEGPNGR
jgi:hypothetical protein